MTDVRRKKIGKKGKTRAESGDLGAPIPDRRNWSPEVTPLPVAERVAACALEMMVQMGPPDIDDLNSLLALLHEIGVLLRCEGEKNMRMMRYVPGDDKYERIMADARGECAMYLVQEFWDLMREDDPHSEPLSKRRGKKVRE